MTIQRTTTALTIIPTPSAHLAIVTIVVVTIVVVGMTGGADRDGRMGVKKGRSRGELAFRQEKKIEKEVGELQ